MAKSSSRSRGKTSTAKRGSKRTAKSTRKKPTRKTGAYGRPANERVIELRPIRLQLQANVAQLGTAIGARKESQPELEEALKRMSRWLDDIQDICGPDMAIPL